MVEGLPAPLRWVNATEVAVRGRRLAYFGGCDYFRLAWNPSVRRAAVRSLGTGPVNVAASRRTTGNLPDHLALESALARFLGFPDAVLTSNGTLPGFHVAEALAGRVDRALLDSRAHACLAQAATMTGVPVETYPSGDAGEVRRRVRAAGRRVRWALFTDGLFGLDGRVAPVVALREALPRGGWMVVDDAHGFGVLGRAGGGVLDGSGVDRERVVQTGTLSKAAGVYGGFVAGPRELADAIRSRGTLYAGSTPLPPPLAAAARVALAWLTGSPGGRHREILARRSRDLRQALVAAGRLPDPGTGPVLTLAPRDPGDLRRLRRRLLERRVYPSFIRYPGCGECGSFRFALSSAHTADQCARLREALAG